MSFVRARCGAQLRRHHCRSCGRTTCGDHSSQLAPVPALRISHPVRVCDLCLATPRRSSFSSGSDTADDDEASPRLLPEPEPEPEPEPKPVDRPSCVASSRCELGCTTIAEHLAGGPTAAAAATEATAAAAEAVATLRPPPPRGKDGRTFADTLASAMADTSGRRPRGGHAPASTSSAAEAGATERTADTTSADAAASAAGAAGSAAGAEEGEGGQGSDQKDPDGELARWEAAAAEAERFLAEADSLLASPTRKSSGGAKESLGDSDSNASAHPSGGARQGQGRSGAPFSALWDQLERVASDVGAQNEAVGSLVQYLEGRWQLEEVINLKQTQGLF